MRKELAYQHLASFWREATELIDSSRPSFEAVLNGINGIIRSFRSVPVEFNKKNERTRRR